MSASNDHRLKAWRAVVTRFEALLYEHDPDGMGASVGAPLDEYSDVAASLVRALRDRPTEDEFADTVRSIVPSARQTLTSDLELVWNQAWADPDPKPKAQGSPDESG